MRTERLALFLFLVSGLAFEAGAQNILTAAPAWADDAGGRIEGKLGDGEISLSIDSGQSDWYGDASSGGVSILTGPVSPQSGLGRLSISFEGSNYQAQGFFAFDVELGIIGTPGVRYTASIDDDLKIISLEISAHGDMLQIEGQVQGTLVRQPAAGGADDRKEIDLQFSGRIGNHY